MNVNDEFLYSDKGRIFFYSLINKLESNLEKGDFNDEFKKEWRMKFHKKTLEYEEDFKEYNEEIILRKKAGPMLNKITKEEIKKIQENKEKIIFGFLGLSMN